MFRRRLYYQLKPFLPRSVRLWLKRRRAEAILKNCSGTWPIKQAAGKEPKNWPGWPDKKSFAFVLTHDVESQKGVDKVRQLAELEMELGFRSSFNFIPEGPYQVPEDLLLWLRENGFEVGVHDLRHDGRLYNSRKAFCRSAKRINHFVKKWGAAGFRSGFMLRNLEWLHDLDVAYDASTFDTDPFEPQPDSANTIFPFWIADSIYPGKGGYMELPYTLPQDSTLYLVLGQKNNNTWKSKLDWVAEKGGMALLNVHPDYIDFENYSQSQSQSQSESESNSESNSHSDDEYSVELYRDFLAYAKDRQAASYWAALPKNVAEYCRDFKPELATREPKRICMLAYSDYESDGRIVRYCQTLVKAGDSVDTIACRASDASPKKKDVEGVTLHGISYRSPSQKKSAVAHLFPLIWFFAKSSWLITRNHFRKRYDLIHVHNIPEWLVFAAFIPRITGAKILLDLHDLVPELYEAKFKRGSRSLVVTPLLKSVEWLCCKFSHHVIISNHLWLKTVTSRSVKANDCSVFFNNIDPGLFYRRDKQRADTDERKLVIFPGTLQWHQGVDVAIRAFPKVIEKVPSAEFHIYGGGGIKEELIDLVRELNLQEKVLFFPSVPIAEVPQLIANADLGVVPKRADSFGNEAYSTKIMEFMSQGVPAVISRTAVDDYYFEDDQVRFCKSGDIDEFAEAMIEVLTNAELREELVKNALEYVSENDWGSRKVEYLDLVDHLIGGIAADAKSRTRTVEVATVPQATCLTN